jgi:NADH dehydrogenase [ubiquinone] 1 alpha subcomplex assembly factor 1
VTLHSRHPNLPALDILGECLRQRTSSVDGFGPAVEAGDPFTLIVVDAFDWAYSTPSGYGSRTRPPFPGQSQPCGKSDRPKGCRAVLFRVSSWFLLAIDPASTALRRQRPPSDNHPVIQPDDPLLLFDFRDPAAVNDWTAIDDRVMGGVSRSRLRHDAAGHAVFEGEVSLERNGGFASVRSSPGARGKPGSSACLIEVRGGGKQFKLSLLTDDGFDSLNYQCSFANDSNDWQTIRQPLGAFRASFRGRDVQGAPALDPARIRQVGLMIAARQAGPFTLEIRRISLA